LATPDPFSTQIDVTFIGQVNGSAKLDLLNSTGQVIATQNFTTEKEEVYTYTFNNLLAVPAGAYTVRYSDSLTNNSITLQKQTLTTDWLVALPNPFRNDLSVYLKAPGAGKADIRLLDIKGRTIETMSLQLTQNEVRNIRFNKAGMLPAGVYLVEYISKAEKKTIKVMKL
jgi:hypothetical protein